MKFKLEVWSKSLLLKLIFYVEILVWSRKLKLKLEDSVKFEVEVSFAVEVGKLKLNLSFKSGVWSSNLKPEFDCWSLMFKLDFRFLMFESYSLHVEGLKLRLLVVGGLLSGVEGLKQWKLSKSNF